MSPAGTDQVHVPVVENVSTYSAPAVETTGAHASDAGANVTVVAAEETAEWLESAAFVAVTVHVPAAPDNDEPETVQFALPADVTSYDTAPDPEPPLVASESGVPAVPDTVVTVNGDCAAGETVRVSVASPAVHNDVASWCAVIVVVPAPTTATRPVPELTVATDVLLLAKENAALLDDDGAETVKVESPYVLVMPANEPYAGAPFATVSVVETAADV